MKTPEGADCISFRDTRAERRVILPRLLEETLLTARTMYLPIKTGVLIMFPSWLQHTVEANPLDKIRVSLAFNIMFSDFTQTQSISDWS